MTAPHPATTRRGEGVTAAFTAMFASEMES